MSNIPIEVKAAATSAGRPAAGDGGAIAEADDVAMAALGTADYCHLAEECFFLAAVANDPEAAAELLKAGHDYLRCAAGLPRIPGR
jgi:hypothetical protein